MKGLSQTLYLVVVAVVVLIIALVLLTIFGTGISPVTDITQAKNICAQKASVSCLASNRLPVDWNAMTADTNSDGKADATCASEFPDWDCEGNQFVDTTLTQTP